MIKWKIEELQIVVDNSEWEKEYNTNYDHEFLVWVKRELFRKQNILMRNHTNKRKS